MNTPHEPDMKRKFKELYVDYKLAVTDAYFSGAQPPNTSSTTTITGVYTNFLTTAVFFLLPFLICGI